MDTHNLTTDGYLYRVALYASLWYVRRRKTTSHSEEVQKGMVNLMKQMTSEAEFREQIAKDTPTVVEFYTTWCPDCRRVSGFIDEVIQKHGDKAFFQVNSEELPDVSDEFEVKGAPSFLIFQNGQKVAHLHSRWAKTQPEIETFLETRESKTI